MYEDKKTYVGINWKDLIIKLILVVLFILLLLWLFPKQNIDTFYDHVFNENVQTMKDAAKDYYTSTKLPSDVGGSVSMTLQEMYDNKIILPFVDKKNDKCDANNSYVQVTKTSDSEYALKVQLTCSDQTDYILDTIGCNGTCAQSSVTCNCTSGNCPTTSNENIGSTGNTSSTNNNVVSNNSSNTNSGTSIEDTSDVIDDKGSACNPYTEYQFKKTVTTTNTLYSCPTGYVKKGSSCYRTVTSSEVTATKEYYNDTTTVTDAIKNDNGSYNVYTTPIVTPGASNTTCPDGYTLKDGLCYKYESTTTSQTPGSYYCPNGYTLNGTQCYIYTNPITNTTTGSYDCPSGYELDGTKCYKYTDAKYDYDYSCSSGYTLSGSTCYKYVNATTSTSAGYSTCPSGYSPYSSTQCRKPVTTSSGYYTAWGNPDSTYTNTISASSTCPSGSTGTTTMTKLTGNKVIGSYRYCSYAKYSRSWVSTSSTSYQYVNVISYAGSTSYSCSSGTLIGSQCKITKTASKTKDYYCPSGYTSKGSGSNKECYKTTSATYSGSSTAFSCPSGYTQSGSGSSMTCYKNTNASISNGTTTYTCPTGYTKLNDTTCYITTTPTTNSTSATYTCPAGYTQTGTGAATLCYKTIKNEDTYYCADSTATLKGDKCYKTTQGGFKKYTCPEGYTLDSDRCFQTTTESIPASASTSTSSSTKYTWSKYSSLAGWEATGLTRSITPENCNNSDVVADK